MKYVIIAVTGLLISYSGFTQGQKKALLIGVGKYAPGSQWTGLSSANDIKYLREAISLHGFEEKNTKILLDAEATKDQIVKALTDLAGNSKTGDIIYLHFSGHGQQIQDQADSGKDEIDGYDEALIPHDVMSGIRGGGYYGEKHLRDDEIKPLLAQMRKNVGSTGSIFITIDACHSGTATRGTAITRGTPIPFEKAGYKPDRIISLQEKKDDGFYDAKEGVGNMVFFSASGPEQVNFETTDANKKGVGSLSFALAKALMELPAGSTYDLLFHKIRQEIQANFPMQTPMIEGDGSQLIFQDKFAKAEDIIRYTFKSKTNDSIISIKQGYVQGISAGSKFSLTSATTKKAEAFGEIISVTPFESIGRITSVADNKKIDQKAGYLLGWEYINHAKPATYQLRNSASVDIYKNQIGRLMNGLSYLTPSDNADFVIDISKREDGTSLIEVIERGDVVRWNMKVNTSDTLTDGQKWNLVDQIKMAMQAKALRQLPNGGDLVNKVKVELLNEGGSFDNTGIAKSYEITLKPQDKYNLKIVNQGGQRVYYTVVNILPDNSTEVLVPLDNEQPKEFHLEPGDSAVIKGFYIPDDALAGKELLRVLFTPEPIDLRPVFNRDIKLKGQTRGAGEVQKVENVLNDLIQTRYTGTTTRSGRDNSTAVSEVGILTVGFTVEKK